jgi:hypothetical protein
MLTLNQILYKPDAKTRFNSGYDDGLCARQRSRHPMWASASQFRSPHPFDKQYGLGFWAGWYGEALEDKQ